MLAIKVAAPRHVFLQQGYPAETMDGVLITADKANTMQHCPGVRSQPFGVSDAVSASVIG
jgi:hypothetical protein